VLHARVRDVLDDGVVTEAERDYLVETLQTLIDEELESLSEDVEITELWFDKVEQIDFRNTNFLLTGNFVYGPIEACKAAIEGRGGVVSQSIDEQPPFLVIAALGIADWQFGGFGREIETALQYKGAGAPLRIIHEETWAANL
jgi:hypothetical protein